MDIDLLYIIAAFILGCMLGRERANKRCAKVMGMALMTYLQHEFNMTKDEALKAMNTFCNYLNNNDRC